jgi:hypothetical protein
VPHGQHLFVGFYGNGSRFQPVLFRQRYPKFLAEESVILLSSVAAGVGIFIESLLSDDLVDGLRCDTGHFGQARKALMEVIATQDVIHVEHDRCGTFAHLFDQKFLHCSHFNHGLHRVMKGMGELSAIA